MSTTDAAPELPNPPAGAAPPQPANDQGIDEQVVLVPIDQSASVHGNDVFLSGRALSSPVSSILRQAESLPADELRELVSQLWWMLPPPNRAELRRPLYESFRLYREGSDQPTPAGRDMLRILFQHNEADKLYSAPRRFDLATIFVVTAFFSLLLGLLTFLDFEPPGKIITSLVITFVGVGQSLTQGRLNPRGVSVVIGAVSNTLMTFIWMISSPRAFYHTPFIGVLLYGLIVGAILGYGAGVLVGGIFLLADKIRNRFGRKEVESDVPSVGE